MKIYCMMQFFCFECGFIVRTKNRSKNRERCIYCNYYWVIFWKYFRITLCEYLSIDLNHL